MSKSAPITVMHEPGRDYDQTRWVRVQFTRRLRHLQISTTFATRPVGYQPGASLLETCPWFDSTGYSRHRIAPGLEVIHRGGPRKRLFWNGHDKDYPAPVLHKIPLVRWQADFSLTASTHALEGAKLAKATGLLLHFKFLQDFAKNAESESRRAEHFMGARGC